MFKVNNASAPRILVKKTRIASHPIPITPCINKQRQIDFISCSSTQSLSLLSLCFCSVQPTTAEKHAFRHASALPLSILLLGKAEGVLSFPFQSQSHAPRPFPSSSSLKATQKQHRMCPSQRKATK